MGQPVLWVHFVVPDKVVADRAADHFGVRDKSCHLCSRLAKECELGRLVAGLVIPFVADVLPRCRADQSRALEGVRSVHELSRVPDKARCDDSSPSPRMAVWSFDAACLSVLPLPYGLG